MQKHIFLTSFIKLCAIHIKRRVQLVWLQPSLSSRAVTFTLVTNHLFSLVSYNALFPNVKNWFAVDTLLRLKYYSGNFHIIYIDDDLNLWNIQWSSNLQVHTTMKYIENYENLDDG